ncbi:hypothetical protein [Guptibacillus algicola]|uniref:hypothetical protein n=1 Tax=Guptibacillus algicola TaxID=225844 RepID=UPI001CD62376|nr:hypothetical protein [Alkalihalobacillus algicola]MCA0987463.1 hypothetical protein [Alkalihalobacillus algicola]
MKKYYLAVTYDVCEHNDLFQDMNEYPIRSSVDMEAEVREFAKLDVAPLVRVYVSDTHDFKNVTLHKDFTFHEYECGCDSRSI